MSDILPQIVPEEPEPAHEELPPETTAVPPAIQPTLADTRLPPAKPPTKPSHRTWWIVGIVAAAILVCSVVCGILFGSAIFKSIVERPNVEKVIDQFMRAMADKDADRAYALFSSRSKRKTPLADIEKLTEGKNYKLFEGYRSVELTTCRQPSALIQTRRKAQWGMRMGQSPTMAISPALLEPRSRKKARIGAFLASMSPRRQISSDHDRVCARP
jgi:hypothetical protein